MAVFEPCPEGTLEKHVASIVLSGRDVISNFPATAWLANFRSRFATKEWSLQSAFDPLVAPKLGEGESTLRNCHYQLTSYAKSQPIPTLATGGGGPKFDKTI